MGAFEHENRSICGLKIPLLSSYKPMVSPWNMNTMIHDWILDSPIFRQSHLTMKKILGNSGDTLGIY